jgi:amino acid transporter
MNIMKDHWETGISLGGLLAAITAGNFNAIVESSIAVATFGFIMVRLAVWILRLRATWRNRNSTHFFEKTKDEE